MDVFTTSDVAKILKISSATVRREIERGKLKCFYVGNEARFTHIHLDEYTNIRNFKKTTRELELEKEIERLSEVIKKKDLIINGIRRFLSVKEA
mgnify:CR=1 FL=1